MSAPPANPMEGLRTDDMAKLEKKFKSKKKWGDFI